MPEVKDLLSKRAQAHQSIIDLYKKPNEEKRGLNADEEAAFQKASAEFDRLTGEIDELKKVEERSGQIAQMQAIVDVDKDIKPSNSTGSPNIVTASPGNGNEDKLEYRDVFNKWVRSIKPHESLSRKEWDVFKERGTNTQVKGTDSLGGYLVPEEWSQELIKAMEYFGGMLEAPRWINSANGRKFHIPTVLNPGGGSAATVKGARIAEGVADTVKDLNFGEKILEDYTYTSGLILASYEQMQDEAYNMLGFIAEVAAERIGRILNEELTTADGSSKPQGVVPATSAGKTTAANNAIIANELIDLEHSVDIAYRRRPGVGFMMHDLTLAHIKKLSYGTTDDRPLWMPSIREGEPDRLLGYRYWINNDMAQIASAAIVMLFGDFQQYWARRIRGVQLVRTDERYVEFRKVGFFAYARFDGELVDARGIKHLLMAT